MTGGPADAVALSGKVAAPRLPRHCVRRPRVERLLHEATERRLALVVGPAGYGKTTLVATWLSSWSGRHGWVSLDSRDNEPTRFWAHLTAALRNAGIDVPHGEVAAGRIERINVAAAALDEDAIVVLDDFHTITDPDIVADVGSLLEQHHPGLRFVVVSRSRPSFVTSRWRANDAVGEVRTHDLAFTPDEADVLLDDVGVVLSPQARDALVTKLSGWAAALHLAMLWMHRRPDQAAAVADFVSSDDTIADYLVTEVLAQLSPAARRFVLLTSTTPWLTAALCNALTGDGDGVRQLAELDSRGLVIHHAGGPEQRFAYSPVLGELLHAELRRTRAADVAGLHLQASAWFSEHGFTEEGIDQAIQAAAWPVVTRLLLAEALAIGSHYQLATVQVWLAHVPHDVRENNPVFLMLLAMVEGYLGHTARGRASAERAKAIAAMNPRDPALPELVALTWGIEVGIARLECDLPLAREASRCVDLELAQIGETSRTTTMARTVAQNSLAGTLVWHGERDEATALLDLVDPVADLNGLARMQVASWSTRALQLAMTGRLRGAAGQARAALDLASTIGMSELFQCNAALLAEAIVSLQQHQPTRTRAMLDVVAERALRHADRGPFLLAALTAAQLAGSEGDPDSGFALIDTATAHWPGWTPPPLLHAEMLAQEARLSILGGNLGAARAALDVLSTVPGGSIAVRFQQRLTDARIHLAAGDQPTGAALLAALGDDAAASSWPSLATTARLEAAVAHQAAGDTTAALAQLDGALGSAQDENIVDPFLTSAAAVRPLLMRMDEGDHDFRRLGFRHRLLSRMGVAVRLAGTGGMSGSVGLSARENTVLRLMLGTLSNHEISTTLSVSPNTVKTHMRSIHRKLGTTNRRDAVSRAKSLGLV